MNRTKEARDSSNKKKDTRDSSNNCKSTSTSLHITVNLSYERAQTQNSTSSFLPNIANPRLIRTPLKKSKSSMLPLSSAKVNPLQRALTTSVSFGRFTSESLDWGKWSAFTHNRYLEEIENYSKPGSVTEKKAYFEAHYKRRRAAALLEQQNAATSNLSERNATHKADANSSVDLETMQTDSYVVTENINEGEAHNCDAVSSVGQNDCRDAVGERNSGDGQPQGVDQVSELFAIKGSPVKLTKHRESDEYLGDIKFNQENDPVELTKHRETDEYLGDITSNQVDDKCKKMSLDGSTMGFSASSFEEKLETSFPKSLENSDKMTMNRMKARDSSNKKKDAMDSSNNCKSTSTSLHITVNLSCDHAQTQKSTSSVLPNIANPRLIRTPLKKPKSSVLPLSSAKASVNRIFKLHAASPLPDNRTVKLHGDSISRSRLIDEKVQSSLKNYSKSSNSFRSKAGSSTVSSPFIFKSEERAERRKEFFQKLEQKLKTEESDTQQRHRKQQVKARGDMKNRVKATKNAELPPLIKSQCNLMKKIPTVRSPKFQENKVLKVQDNDSRPPWRFSMKIDSSKKFSGKNNYAPICSAKSFLKRSRSENTSPISSFD